MSKAHDQSKSSTANDPDAQFLKDLEEAKRLSLATFSLESHGNSDGTPGPGSSSIIQPSFAGEIRHLDEDTF
jgi:hypothetical protein